MTPDDIELGEDITALVIAKKCRHCRWWKKVTAWGICQLTAVTPEGSAFIQSRAVAGGRYTIPDGARQDFHIWLDTTPDFGCNQWEYKR